MKNLTLALLFIGCLLITLYSARAVRINEIMYNPIGNDYDFEYLELFAENLTDVSNYSFEGITFTFPENYSFDGYLLLANTNYDEDNDFQDRYNVSPDFEYSGTLSNNGEAITLYDANRYVIDFVVYDPGTEGYSLEYYNGEFVESLVLHGTPGSENQFVDNSSVDPVPENEANETNTTNQTNSILTGCDFSISILLDKEIYENKERIIYDLDVDFQEGDDEYSYYIEYFIEDLSGDLIRKKRNTTNPGKKSFTPSIKESDKLFFIKAKIYPNCNDIDMENNHDSATVIVRNNVTEDEIEEEKGDVRAKTISEEKKEKEKKSEKKAEIQSFYTRHKKFEQGRNISLYAMLYNPNGDRDFDIGLLNNGKSIENFVIPIKEDHKKRLNMTISLEPGLNNLSLIMSKEGKKEAFESIEIWATPNQEPVPVSENKYKPDETKITGASVADTLDSHGNKAKKQIKTEEEKQNAFVQYIILGVSVLLNSVLIWRR